MKESQRFAFVAQHAALFDRPLGARFRDIHEVFVGTAHACGAMLDRCATAGELFRAGVKGYYRYFLTADARDGAEGAARASAEKERTDNRATAREAKRVRDKIRYERVFAEARAARTSPPLKRGRKPGTVMPSRPAKSHHAAPRPTGPVVIPDHVKVQVVPGFERTCASAERVIGGFATLGIGRYPAPPSRCGVPG